MKEQLNLQLSALKEQKLRKKYSLFSLEVDNGEVYFIYDGNIVDSISLEAFKAKDNEQDLISKMWKIVTDDCLYSI